MTSRDVPRDLSELARSAYPEGQEGLSVRWITSQGTRVRCVEAGSPEFPPVVLLPGWGCTAYTFRHNVPAIADAGWRTVVVEPPGQGWSEKPTGAAHYTLSSLAHSVRGALDALGIVAAPIIGQSLGGAIATQLALDAPDRVRQLALWSPIGFGCSWIVHAGAVLPTGLAPLLERIVGRSLVRMGLEVVYGRARRPTPVDVREYAAPIRSPGYVQSQIELLRNVSWDAMDDEALSRVAQSVLILGGRADPLVPAKCLEDAAVKLPRATIRLIAGGGHAVNETHPEEVNGDTLSFLRVPDGTIRG